MSPKTKKVVKMLESRLEQTVSVNITSFDGDEYISGKLLEVNEQGIRLVLEGNDVKFYDFVGRTKGINRIFDCSNNKIYKNKLVYNNPF